MWARSPNTMLIGLPWSARSRLSIAVIQENTMIGEQRASYHLGFLLCTEQHMPQASKAVGIIGSRIMAYQCSLLLLYRVMSMLDMVKEWLRRHTEEKAVWTMRKKKSGLLVRFVCPSLFSNHPRKDGDGRAP